MSKAAKISRTTTDGDEEDWQTLYARGIIANGRQLRGDNADEGNVDDDDDDPRDELLWDMGPVLPQACSAYAYWGFESAMHVNQDQIRALINETVPAPPPSTRPPGYIDLDLRYDELLENQLQRHREHKLKYPNGLIKTAKDETSKKSQPVIQKLAPTITETKQGIIMVKIKGQPFFASKISIPIVNLTDEDVICLTGKSISDVWEEVWDDEVVEIKKKPKMKMKALILPLTPPPPPPPVFMENKKVKKHKKKKDKKLVFNFDDILVPIQQQVIDVPLPNVEEDAKEKEEADEIQKMDDIVIIPIIQQVIDMPNFEEANAKEADEIQKMDDIIIPKNQQQVIDIQLPNVEEENAEEEEEEEADEIQKMDDIVIPIIQQEQVVGVPPIVEDEKKAEEEEEEAPKMEETPTTTEEISTTLASSIEEDDGDVLDLFADEEDDFGLGLF